MSDSRLRDTHAAACGYMRRDLPPRPEQSDWLPAAHSDRRAGSLPLSKSSLILLGTGRPASIRRFRSACIVLMRTVCARRARQPRASAVSIGRARSAPRALPCGEELSVRTHLPVAVQALKVVVAEGEARSGLVLRRDAV